MQIALEQSQEIEIISSTFLYLHVENCLPGLFYIIRESIVDNNFTFFTHSPCTHFNKRMMSPKQKMYPLGSTSPPPFLVYVLYGCPPNRTRSSKFTSEIA